VSGITVTLNGVEQLKAKIAAAVPAARQNIKAALYQFAEEVMTASKEVVPVDTGALMNSGKVMPPEEDGDTVTVTLGYGDESVGYAVYVHEDMDPGVHWSRPGSGPHFLANPLHERQDSLPGRIAEAAMSGFKG
jgi:hypothetical protein